MPTPDDLRSELRALGARRRAHDAESKALHKDTALVVRRALRLKSLPMSEVASLLGLERTYLYRLARR